jgi:hypothetical protein
MDFKRLVIAASVFAILAAGAYTGFQVADLGQKDAPANEIEVTNETIPQQYGVYQLVDNATAEYQAGFKDNVTVYNSSQNTTAKLVEGEDYEWNSTDGAIKFIDTPSTNESRKANISYTWLRNTQRVREVSGPIRTVVNKYGLLAYLAGGLSLVVVLLVFGGIIARRLSGGMPDSNR